LQSACSSGDRTRTAPARARLGSLGETCSCLLRSSTVRAWTRGRFPNSRRRDEQRTRAQQARYAARTGFEDHPRDGRHCSPRANLTVDLDAARQSSRQPPAVPFAGSRTFRFASIRAIVQPPWLRLQAATAPGAEIQRRELPPHLDMRVRIPEHALGWRRTTEGDPALLRQD
jgi:hypothetical protein